MSTIIKSKKPEHINKIALFKGRFIEEFLEIEYLLEKIIVRYFMIQPQPLPEDFRLTKINYPIAVFFESFLFLDPAFGFNQKFNGAKLVMQLTDPNYYGVLTGTKSSPKPLNIFNLIEYLSYFRNLMAHNLALCNTPMGIEAIKFSREFYNRPSEIVDEITKKKIPVNNFGLSPKATFFIITQKAEAEIFSQLNVTNKFFSMYLHNDFKLNKETVSKENKYRDLGNTMFNDSKIFATDVGVFKFYTDQKKKKKE